MKAFIIIVFALHAGCDSTGAAGFCADPTPLRCPGTGDCCPADAPIHCGDSCWNGVPSATQCSATVSTCTDNSKGGSPCVSGSYCYEWVCSGDPECLSTNPNGTAVGANDEGNDASCSGLTTFGTHFWGIPPAWQACVLIP